MFEEVAGECEIDRLLHQLPDLDRRSDDRLNPRLQITRKVGPGIEPYTLAGHNRIDKGAVSTTDIEDAIIRSNELAEIIPPKSAPQHNARRIMGKTELDPEFRTIG